MSLFLERCVSFGGYFAMIGLAWLLSENKVRFPWRAVVVGTLLQFALAMLILSTTPGRVVFEGIGAAFTWVSDMADEGSKFVFGERFLEHPFAFKVLPTIIFFSSLAAMLYYLGIMQWVVKSMAARTNNCAARWLAWSARRWNRRVATTAPPRGGRSRRASRY